MREPRKRQIFKKVICGSPASLKSFKSDLWEARYLFEDGTTGTIEEEGSHTIVGVVVREKTATEDGLAVGLRFFCIERKPLLAK